MEKRERNEPHFPQEVNPDWADVDFDLLRFLVNADLVNPAIFNVMDKEQQKHLCAAFEGIYKGSDGDPKKLSWIGM